MFLCDWQIFWLQHYEHAPLVEALNAVRIKSVWDYWVDWFGLTPEPDETDRAILEMREKAAQLRRRSKKR